MHFYHPDRSAVGAGRGYGLRLPGGSEASRGSCLGALAAFSAQGGPSGFAGKDVGVYDIEGGGGQKRTLGAGQVWICAAFGEVGRNR